MSRHTVGFRFRSIEMEVELNATGKSESGVTKYGQPTVQSYDTEVELMHVCVGSDSVDILDLLNDDVREDIKNKCILTLNDDGPPEPPEDDRF